MKGIGRIFCYAGCIVASSVIWIFLSSSGLLDGIDQETLRWRYLVRGEIELKHDPVRYVDIDAATISRIGDKPWDRRNFGRVMDALLGLGEAKVVSLDVILSKFGAGGLLDFERARSGEMFLGEVVQQYEDQIVLAAAYTNLSAALIAEEKASLPLIREGNYDPETNAFPEAPTFPIINHGVGRIALANVDEGLSGGSIPLYVPLFVELAGPRYGLHLLDGRRRFLAHALNEPDVIESDGRLILVDQDGWEPGNVPAHDELTIFSLALETFLAAHGLSADDVSLEPDRLLVWEGTEILREIPLTESQSLEVNWFEGWDLSSAHGRVSMGEVLERAAALERAEAAGDRDLVESERSWFEQFRGKVVFVGPVDPLLKDIAPTPFNRNPVPKVGLHGNLFRTIETGEFIQRTGVLVKIALIIGLTLVVALLALGSGWARLLSVFVLLLYTGLSLLLFAQQNLVLPMVAPTGAAVMAAFAVVLLKIGSEEWQRRRIKTLFGAYVSPSLVNEMIDSPRDPELGGIETAVTALFSDVEGFSAISEELSPSELVRLMNEYLGELTETFQEEQGTLDKYVGDAIVTMFGMPYPVEDHAARACRSAIRMQERHAALRERWREAGKWPERVLQMRTRIGVNTGIAVIGNMGSRMRFNYTMMGDSVNLAARCESGAKSYGVYTMITASTLEMARQAGEHPLARKLDRIVVEGRSQSVEVYELWDGTVDQEKAVACKTHYEKALEHYFAGEWQRALEGFEEADQVEPSAAFAPTTPSRVLSARCREFAEKGAPENWDGVYRMRTK
jgi:adenylate cyclase